jgi:hypothetical protein
MRNCNKAVAPDGAFVVIGLNIMPLILFSVYIFEDLYTFNSCFQMFFWGLPTEIIKFTDIKSRVTDKCFVKATINLAAFTIIAHTYNTWATFVKYAYTIKIKQ